MILAQKSKWLTPPRSDVIRLLPVAAIAFFFRFYQLANIPPDVDADESATAWLATTILREARFAAFFSEGVGRLPMQVYLEAVSFHLTGVSVFAARAVSAVIGVLTVVLLYFLVKRLFASSSEKASLLALLSSLLLAASYWHLVPSRFATEWGLLPFFVTAGSLLFWRAIESERSSSFVWAGLVLGISAYSYPPVYFLPLLFLSFLGYRVLLNRGRPRLWVVNTVVLFSVAIVAFLPLGHYALSHPDWFLERTREVSVFNPEHNQGSPVRAFVISTATTVGMFSFRGDPRWARNPAGRPVLDPLSSVIFMLGIAVAVRRYRQAPYLFVVLSLVVMCLPGALTAAEIPSYIRTTGAVPAVCILLAIGIETLWDRFKRWRTSLWQRRLFWLGVSIFCVWTGALSFHDYFTVAWPAPEAPNKAFVEAAEAMNQLAYGPEAVWIFPRGHMIGPRQVVFSVESLYAGNSTRHYLDLDELEVARRLARGCQGYAQAMVVDWKIDVPKRAYSFAYADPKRVLPFLLTKYGRFLEEFDFETLNVLVYQLPGHSSFSIADDFQPMNVEFGRELRLTGVAIGGSSQNATSTREELNSVDLPSGKSGWVVLKWEALSQPSQDYKVGVCLVDQGRRTIGQADKLLLSNDWQPTSQWAPGQQEMDYYTLPTMAGTAPGWYDVQVAVYNEETMERLPVLNETERTIQQAATVGRLQLVTPIEPAMVQPAQRLAETEGSLVPNVRLLGYDLPARAFYPGDSIPLALYWKALGTVHRDCVIAIQLRDQQGRIRAQEEGRPVYGTYPTKEWAPGEVLRDWHDLTLEPTIPDGSYQLELQVKEVGRVLGEISLGSVEVEGRAHLFQIPEMQHRLGIRLGEEVTLLGYDLSTDWIRAGETLSLTLYWQALTEMDISYTVFTHLLDEQGRMWGQKDSVPGAGQLPTTGWVKGEVIEDHYEIAVSGEAPPGEYVLESGMYHWETGKRLPVVDEHGIPLTDSASLGSVEIASRN